jgi:transcriptional regulator with XRE-family HTH domain
MNSDKLLKVFSQNVERLRLEAGLSQEHLAQRCSRFRKQIPKIQDGTANVTLAMILALADALGVEPALLLQDKTGP